MLLLAVASQGVPVQASTPYEYRFPDGTQIKVHFKQSTLDAAGVNDQFASSVLDAAVSAYQTLVQFEGFNTPGYSFTSPDLRYAYDPDRTIDIYLGDPQGGNWFEELGPKNKLFRDAPCFDTRKTGDARYEAMIFLPANYPEFIRNWEKLNPSSLGSRNVHVDLRGTLIHEMTHVLLFYYNKNLDKAGEEPVHESGPAAGQHLDWYVEGLARYFETLAGARHDFYSQGFKQTLPDKIRFSRGGSNYFMRYPDQAFTQLRYENALFWRFIDTRFGMEAIEALSRRLRGRGADFRGALEETTGMNLEALLTEYASAVLLGEFGLKDDKAYLHEIATTRLLLEEGAFYLLDGHDGRKRLGASCATDWIGRWEDVRVSFGEPAAAGDATDAADVSAWATDFIEIRLGNIPGGVPELRLRHRGQGLPLRPQLFIFTRGGSIIRKELPALWRGKEGALALGALLSANALRSEDIEKVVLAVTNTDPVRTSPYEIRLV